MARQPVKRTRSRKPSNPAKAKKSPKPGAKSSQQDTYLMVAILVSLLLLACGLGVYVWYQLGDVEISGHGILALVLGVGFSLALGIGLMRLVYVSHRRGFD